MKDIFYYIEGYFIILKNNFIELKNIFIIIINECIGVHIMHLPEKIIS